MEDTSQESNQKMFTVRLMERPALHLLLNLSQEELTKKLMSNTTLVSEVNSLIILKMPEILRPLLKLSVLREEILASLR